MFLNSSNVSFTNSASYCSLRISQRWNLFNCLNCFKKSVWNSWKCAHKTLTKKI